ncbi:hypothetical protein COV18_05425 [Candidatus Woesearchaeota archaeon CG10_big_fil_rev_8_21_14_0_10_37_12]|nr:MAG: hypothetical protein COV18_05425 [Candidatus Woesearchaeota archaeon CG10_big_fil_rev_8_21_14_0_10_37_12]
MIRVDKITMSKEKLKKIFSTQRTLAIIILITAGLLFYTQQKGALLLSISGIILLFAPTKTSQKQFDNLKNALKHWKTILLTAIYDAGYWALLFATLTVTNSISKQKLQAIQSSDYFSKAAFLDPGQSVQLAAAYQNVFILLILTVVIVGVLSLLIYSISRALIWTTIAGKSTNKKAILGFLGTNTVWWLVLLPFFALLFIGGAKQPAALKSALIALFFVIAYFAPIINVFYLTTNKMGKSVAHGIGWGIAHCYKLFVPYAYVCMVYVVVTYLFRIAQTSTQTIYYAWIIILAILFFSWLRVFLYPTLKELSKE